MPVKCDAWINNQKESVKNANNNVATTSQKLTVDEVISLVLNLDVSKIRYFDNFSTEESFIINSETDDRQNSTILSCSGSMATY